MHIFVIGWPGLYPVRDEWIVNTGGLLCDVMVAGIFLQADLLDLGAALSSEG